MNNSLKNTNLLLDQFILKYLLFSFFGPTAKKKKNKFKIKYTTFSRFLINNVNFA